MVLNVRLSLGKAYGLHSRHRHGSCLREADLQSPPLSPPFPSSPFSPFVPPSLPFSIPFSIFPSPSRQAHVGIVPLVSRSSRLYLAKHIFFTKPWNNKVTEGECRGQAHFTVLRPVTKLEISGTQTAAPNVPTNPHGGDRIDQMC